MFPEIALEMIGYCFHFQFVIFLPTAVKNDLVNKLILSIFWFSSKLSFPSQTATVSWERGGVSVEL